MPEGKALQDVYELAEAMNKFGPLVVILSVFLIIFLGVIVFFLKSYTETQKQIMSQQQSLLNGLLEKNDKEDDKPAKAYDEHNIVEIFCKLNTHLKAECRKFLEKTQCDRIGIYVFHNGTVASHGLPFFKISCICEYIRRNSGICQHMTDSTNLPLSLFDDIIEKLYLNGTVTIRNNVPGALQSDSFFLDKDKAATALFTVVYDGEDNAMAFVLGEYRDALTTEEIENDFVIYKELCARLKPVLEFSEFQKLGNIEKG